jgi:PAS domain-containing protein
MPATELKWPTLLNTVSPYALAFAAGLAAIALRIWLTPLLGARNPYHTAWAAVVFAAWYCGFGPAILATLTSATGIWFWFLESDRSQPNLYRMDLWGVLGFLLFSVVVIAFGEAMRRAKAEVQQSEESLRESEARLRLVNQNMADVILIRTAELEQKSVNNVEQARLLDLANDAIFVRDARDRISYWNQGAERLYGWT